MIVNIIKTILNLFAIIDIIEFERKIEKADKKEGRSFGYTTAEIFNRCLSKNFILERLIFIRLRLLDSCYEEVRTADPERAVSKHFIRQLALTNQIRTVMAGRKRLIDLDSLFAYLAGTKQNAG